MAAVGNPATGGRTPPGSVTLCAPGQHIRVNGPWGHYVIKNNDFYPRAAPQCITHHRSGPNFAVTTSRANARGAESDAYPNIFSGCSWGTCSGQSALPAPLFSLHQPWVSWYARLRPHGKWDANLDIWLSPAAQVRGQVTGAEVMIWMSARGFGHPQTTTRIDRIGWHLAHWTTRSLSQPRVTWPLIIFRAAHARRYLRRLALMPFFRDLLRLHLIRHGYWLDSLHAGFEIWTGGYGLSTLWFREDAGQRRRARSAAPMRPASLPSSASLIRAGLR
jgi:hypothetical protein